MLGLMDLLILVLVWLVVHINGSGVYLISNPGFLVGSIVWLVLLVGFMYYECHMVMFSNEQNPSAVQDLNQRFEDGEHGAVLLATLAFLLCFTIVVCIDSQLD